jgi:DNA-binding MarR family transcriptional regulator
VPQDDRERLIDAIASASAAIGRARASGGPEPWLHLDLTLPQFKVLLLLDAVGPSRPGAIAEAIGATATGVTGILDRLEERALVQREPDARDRRATVVRLERAAQAILDEVYSAGRERMVEVLRRLDDRDLRALHQGMAALLAEQTALVAEREAARASASGAPR